MNKTQLVKEHLLRKGNITSWEAITNYGATRLSAIIFNLRKTMDIDTMMIECTDRNGDATRYGKYIYKGEK